MSPPLSPLRRLRRHYKLAPIFSDAWRFLVAGGFNTLFTLLLYQLLLLWTGEKPAWTIAWFCGILLVSFAYPKLVFKEGRLTRRRFAANTAYYLCSYLLSLGLLALCTDKFGVHPRLAAFLVLAVTVPLNFAFSRLIFTAKANSEKSAG